MVDVRPNSRRDPRRRSILLYGLCAALVVSAASVVSHDLFQRISFNPYALCQRSDESFWRDPSNGCFGGEDPRCTAGTGCADSTMVSEGWRHACSWLLFGLEVGPRGEEPFHEGPSPGGGCLGRR